MPNHSSGPPPAAAEFNRWASYNAPSALSSVGEPGNGRVNGSKSLGVTMNTHDKQDCESTIRRINDLLASGIFEQKHAGNVLVQSAFIELMICLRDLLHKTEKYVQRVSFEDDILPNSHVKDATDAITAVRDAACHINSFKQLFDDNGNRGTFNVAYGKCNFMKIGDLELKSEYEDDFAVFYGSNRLYFRRTILRAFQEAVALVQPLLHAR